MTPHTSDDQPYQMSTVIRLEPDYGDDTEETYERDRAYFGAIGQTYWDESVQQMVPYPPPRLLARLVCDARRHRGNSPPRVGSLFAFHRRPLYMTRWPGPSRHDPDTGRPNRILLVTVYRDFLDTAPQEFVPAFCDNHLRTEVPAEALRVLFAELTDPGRASSKRRGAPHIPVSQLL